MGRRPAGVMIRNEAEAARLVEAQLRGVGPWSAREDVTPADGLARALADAGPWEPVFARTLAAHLESPDVAVRTLALVVIAPVAGLVGAESLAGILTRSRHLFAGVRPEGHPTNQPDLRWSLLVAIGTAVGPADAHARALLVEAATEGRGSWLVDALARVDLPWLLSHAKEVLPKAAVFAGLRAMPDLPARKALLVALGPWTDADRAATLSSPAWALVPDATALTASLSG